MNTLEKYNLLKQQQLKEHIDVERKAKEISIYNKNERKALYAKFVKLISPFNGESLNKHKITLKFDNKNTKVEMFIDKKLYVIFSIDSTYYHCNCSECADGGYSHEGEYRTELNTYSMDKNNKKQEIFFSWYDNADEDVFVNSMDKLISDYE